MSNPDFIQLTIPMPIFPSHLEEIYNETLKPCLSVEELVSMVIFIEYFADDTDRDHLRSEYLTSVLQRWGKYNVGTRGTTEQFLQLLMSHNYPLPFDPYRFLAGHQPWSAVTAINRIREKFQRHYLYVSENVDVFYNAVVSFYSNSPRQRQVLSSLATEFMGFLPKITVNRDRSLELTVIRHSVI